MSRFLPQNDEDKTMTLSSTTSLKFSNPGKLESLSEFIDEYGRVVRLIIDELWDLDRVPGFIPKETSSKIDTWLSARAIQAAGKQASGIVRGTRGKIDKLKFVERKLKSEGKNFQKLSRKIEKTRMSKPDVGKCRPMLDSRFVDVEMNVDDTSFNIWVKISSIGRKMKIEFPARMTRHIDSLIASGGTLRPSVSLSKKDITFSFELPDPEPKATGDTIGVDIGVNKGVASSDGQVSGSDIHGWTLSNILDRMSCRKRGSRGFERTQRHRKNHIRWMVNQLNLDDVEVLRMEDIKNLRRGERSNRKLSHWTYSDISDRLEDRCVRHGVRVERLDPAFTSRRCSGCGWTKKANRSGESFECGSCGFAADADMNAAINLSISLPPLVGERRTFDDVNGFFWTSSGVRSGSHSP